MIQVSMHSIWLNPSSCLGWCLHLWRCRLAMAVRILQPACALQIASMVDDPFIGMLQENDYDSNSIIGGTTRKIFLQQFHAIFFGPEGSWWRDSAGQLGSYAAEVEATTLGVVIGNNTGAAVDDDVFRV